MKTLAIGLEEDIRHALTVAEMLERKIKTLQGACESVLEQYAEKYGLSENDKELKALNAMHEAYAKVVEAHVASVNLEEKLEQGAKAIRQAQWGL